MKMRIIIAILVLSLILVIGCASEQTIMQEKEKTFDEKFVDRPMEPSEEEGIQVTSTGVKYLVHPNKITGGGPPKDGIPSIDNPKYISVEEADAWIADNELVLAITYKSVKRVYPLQILVWHEIVNDKIAGDPLLITYCPLCG